MKVMVFGADSFLGIHAVTRFCRDNYKVVGVYNHQSPAFAADVPHSKYVCKNEDGLKDIFQSERPDVIIYTRTNRVTTLQESRKKVSDITNLAELSSRYHTSKFIYLSDVAVYGSSLKTEEDKLEPMDLNAKTHLLCESAIQCFRPSKEFFNVFLRLSQVCGYYDTLDHPSPIFRMVDEAIKTGMIVSGTGDSYRLISSGDAVEAMIKSISDSVDGVYNITADSHIVTGGEIAALIYQKLNLPKKLTASASEAESLQNADDSGKIVFGQKAAADMGFFPKGDIGSIVDECISWHNDNKRVKKRKIVKSESKNKFFPRLIENILFFAALASLTYLQSDQSASLSTSLLTIYIIIISVYFGITQGIIAAVLVSAFNVYSMFSLGYSISATFYNINVIIQIVQNLIIAMSIGYVIERKNFTIFENTLEIESKDQELTSLKQINNDLSVIKNEQEKRILQYDFGLGKLYSSIKSLNTLSPQDVFWGTLTAIRDLTGVKNISLYLHQPNNAFLRQFIFLGEKPKRFPKSYHIPDNDQLADIIRNNRLYTNNFLNMDMPSVILPISVEGSVNVLVVIEDMEFDKLNLYFMNVLHITKDLLDDAYRNADIYKNLSALYAYEGNTNILVEQEFNKVLSLAKRGFETSGYEYTVLELVPDSGQDVRDMAKTVRGLVRTFDEIGRLPDGGVGVVLSSTSGQDAEKVIERFEKNGIRTRILNL